MPTKTERILDHLPGTFRALPRPGALHALVDAFGSELQMAENCLAAILAAHWVDHADRGAPRIDDLARLAALYGLAPRSDETVEAFREHLKRYIRTFLEGPVTVQGILRVTAEALALPIEAEWSRLDCWWQRKDDRLITHLPVGSDAARQVLGFHRIVATGRPEQAASVTGRVTLAGRVELPPSAALRLAVDDAPATEISLEGIHTLQGVVERINAALGMNVAFTEGHRLVLRSPTRGPASRLELEDLLHDAAPALLGLAPRRYLGSDATTATVTGSVDLSAGADLSEERYLRLVIDGTTVAEVDCAGADPARTTLDEIRDAINTALGAAVADHDGRFLTLRSPSSGGGSSIAFQQPAAQDATRRLFGEVRSLYAGEDALPARVKGRPDLSGGVDLDTRANIAISLDGAPPQTIHCAGADPAATTLDEVVQRINQAMGTTIAGHDGRHLILTSPTVGAESAIRFDTPAEGDATEILFGIAPRRFTGSAAAPATIHGRKDLDGGIDVSAHYRLCLAVDHGAPVSIDLRSATADSRAATLDELVGAINDALSRPVASHDGRHLILTSPTAGGASRLEVAPLTRRIERRFVSRAPISDEAARRVLGFVSRKARGRDPAPAVIRGTVDLSRGVDLRETPYLRLAIDGGAPQEIDCRGTPARATLPDEITRAINRAVGEKVAHHDGRRLTLISPSKGPESRIRLEPPRAEDALETLLGFPPTERRGDDATGVRFVATVDLSDGVDLSGARRIRLGYDDQPAVEIDCAGTNPAATSLSEIVVAINLALDEMVATHDGRRLHLTSPSRGAGSRIRFEKPSADDATPLVFGITAPRSYHGREAVPARLTGKRELEGTLDLSVRRYLRLKLDRDPFRSIDCAAAAADPARVTLDEVIAAINEALGTEVAGREGNRLRLTSPRTGSGSRLAVEYHTSGDARPRLFGDAPDHATGTGAEPAVIEGERPLSGALHLRHRSLLRLALDDEPPLEIDIAGPVPGETFPADIVAAIDAVLPGCASLTPDGRLRLASPGRGHEHRLAVLPLRHLEVEEYPPHPVASPPRVVGHGDGWSFLQRGAGGTEASLTLETAHGVAGPALLNESTGLLLRLQAILRPGERLEVTSDARHGLAAWIGRKEALTSIPPERISVAPPGGVLTLPWAQATPLTRNREGQDAVSLIDPLTPRGVTLRARSERQGKQITVAVDEGMPATAPPPEGKKRINLPGILRRDDAGWRLEDSGGNLLVRLLPAATAKPALLADKVVAATGTLFAGTPPTLVAERMARLYRVTLAGDGIEESYVNVTLGADPGREDDLVRRINTAPSALVKAVHFPKKDALSLPPGRNHWRFLACKADRFDSARFDEARFAGGVCSEPAVFDVSRFTPGPPEPGRTIFAGAPDSRAGCNVTFRWNEYRPGAFTVNLPADLPARFGGRFDEARFGHAPGEGEHYEQVITEPPEDERFLVNRINAQSALVQAAVVPFVPQGWQAVTIPFREPVALSLGTRETPARLYLREEGLAGFVEIRARSAGEWGNGITLTVRASGPARFDVAITLPGARFENARHIVLGKDPEDRDPFLPPRIPDLLRPGPVGILQAKAAGIHASVTRDLTERPVDSQKEKPS